MAVAYCVQAGRSALPFVLCFSSCVKEEVGAFIVCTGAKFMICLTAKDCFRRATVSVCLKVGRSEL